MSIKNITTIWGNWIDVKVKKADVCISAYSFANEIGTIEGISKILNNTKKIAFFITPYSKIQTDFGSEDLYKELGEKINLDPKTIGRIISGETKGSINSIILICLGLNLPPSISGHIIKNCPHSIDMTDGSHQWYSFVLTYQYTKSIKEIRSFLLENGAEPL